MKAASQRLDQGIRALLAFATSPELSLAQQNLTEAEYAAFRQMSRAEQLHSIKVLRNVLESESVVPPELKAAALMHDVGKSRYHLAVWQKTLAVLVTSLAPDFNRRLSRGKSLSLWRAPFIVRSHHPQWSADILRECGSDEAVVWLAAHHQQDSERLRDHPLYSLLVSLQLADNDS